MVICVTCNVNAICTDCIKFDLENNDLNEVQFHCPMCFIKENKLTAYVCGFACICHCIY